MLGRDVGLVTFVERARDRALSRRHIQNWLIESNGFSPEWADEVRQTARDIADKVICLCWEGKFRSAVDYAAGEHFEPVRVNELAWNAQYLFEVPSWLALPEAVRLAERIDSFLAVLERGDPGALLARDCRQELDLLCVLADWCQDAGQLQVAEEARHLHALACSLYRG
jgi:hypothetical protein